PRPPAAAGRGRARMLLRGPVPAGHQPVHRGAARADRRCGGRQGGLLRGHRRDHGGGSPVSLLELDHVAVRYGAGRHALTAVDDVSLAVEAGTSIGIVGESGSGKSTLARAIVQLVPTASGRITLDGRDVTGARGSA